MYQPKFIRLLDADKKTDAQTYLYRL